MFKFISLSIILCTFFSLSTADAHNCNKTGLKKIKLKKIPGVIRPCKSSKDQWISKYRMCVVKYKSGCHSGNGPYSQYRWPDSSGNYVCKYDDGSKAFTFRVY